MTMRLVLFLGDFFASVSNEFRRKKKMDNPSTCLPCVDDGTCTLLFFFSF